MAKCQSWADHELPAGTRWVTGRGCDHDLHVDRSTPVVRCRKCQAALGKECPNCEGVY